MITRENAKELLPIIKAYSEGKDIEILVSTGEWELLTDPYFDNEPSRYRIKREPKYRPFKSVEECWEEMQKHQPFGWIIMKSTQLHCIISLDADADFYHRFKNYLFADGAPYGIKEEE